MMCCLITINSWLMFVHHIRYFIVYRMQTLIVEEIDVGLQYAFTLNKYFV